MRRAHLAVFVLAACVHANCAMTTAAQGDQDEPRRKFLQQLDESLASRDPNTLAALADVDRWYAAGRPPLQPSTLWLPPAPLKRVEPHSAAEQLSPNEVVYQDGDGERWRVRLRRDEERGVWRVTIYPQPCPPRPNPRGGFSTRGDENTAPGRTPTTPASVWTPVECFRYKR